MKQKPFASAKKKGEEYRTHNHMHATLNRHPTCNSQLTFLHPSTNKSKCWNSCRKEITGGWLGRAMTALSLATWLKMQFRGHLIHPQPPTFCGFHPSELPKRPPRTPYLGPLGCGKLQAQAQTGGCPNGSTGSNAGKKLIFLKNDPTPCATLKQVFLDRLELVVAHFGSPKIPKCLENGLFWDQKWVKNGSKTHFSKSQRRPFVWGAPTGEMSSF